MGKLRANNGSRVSSSEAGIKLQREQSFIASHMASVGCASGTNVKSQASISNCSVIPGRVFLKLLCKSTLAVIVRNHRLGSFNGNSMEIHLLIVLEAESPRLSSHRAGFFQRFSLSMAMITFWYLHMVFPRCLSVS